MPNQPVDPDLKAAILSRLRERAKAGRTITCGNLGLLVGKQARGPWKAILDEIGDDERLEGRPDLACLVVRALTGFPSDITETGGGKTEALAERQRVFRPSSERPVTTPAAIITGSALIALGVALGLIAAQLVPRCEFTALAAGGALCLDRVTGEIQFCRPYRVGMAPTEG